MDYNTASNGACGINQPNDSFRFLAPPANQIQTLNTFNVVQTVNPLAQANNPAGLLLAANDSFTSIGIMRADGQGVNPPGQAHSMQDSPANSTISVGLGGGGNNNNLRLVCRSDNGQLVNIDGGNFVGTGWQIVCWQYDWTTFTGKLIINGVTNTGTNVLMNNWVFGNPTSVYYLGCNYNIPPFFEWQGYIGEFVEYTGIKTNAQINQLGNYFANKYGLVWTNI
jgi:hypothetical protein